MKTNDRARLQGRRTFLMYLTLGGGALGAGLSLRADAVSADESTQDERAAPSKQGYRETAHVREYYAKASL